jgi:hypothetical protein
MAGPATRIAIEPTAIRGERGQRYRVHFHGAVLIEETCSPEFDTCRLLLARGFTGTLEVCRVGQPKVCMRLDIEAAAKLTVAVTATTGPRIVGWVPLPEEAFPDAVSRSGGSLRKGENDFRVPGHPSTETPAGWVG